MTSITDQIASGSIAFARWDDEAAAEGFETFSNDTLVWLTPILGPTSTLLLHRIAWYHDSGVILWIADADELAATFGVGVGHLRLTLLRLENFGMIAGAGEHTKVRSRIPKLPRRWRDRYPTQLREICPWWV